MLPQRAGAELPAPVRLQPAKEDPMPRLLRRAVLCGALMSLCPLATAMPPELVGEAGAGAYEAGRLDEAARLFELAARAGNRLAQYNYAMMLLRGETKAAWETGR